MLSEGVGVEQPEAPGTKAELGEVLAPASGNCGFCKEYRFFFFQESGRNLEFFMECRIAWLTDFLGKPFQGLTQKKLTFTGLAASPHSRFQSSRGRVKAPSQNERSVHFLAKAPSCQWDSKDSRAVLSSKKKRPWKASAEPQGLPCSPRDSSFVVLVHFITVDSGPSTFQFTTKE